MKNEIGNWQYHVATMVRDVHGNWKVIDPLFSEPMMAELWAKKMQEMSTNNSLQFFVSEPQRVYPNTPSKYSKSVFEEPEVNPFYRDLMEQSRKDSQQQGR